MDINTQVSVEKVFDVCVCVLTGRGRGGTTGQLNR